MSDISSGNTESKPKNRISILIPIMLVVLIVAVFGIMKYELGQTNSEIESLKNELNIINSGNRSLKDELKRQQMELEVLTDAADIEEYAKSLIGKAASGTVPNFIVPESKTDNAIIEKNIRQLSSIQNYGPNVAIEYISPEKNKNKCYIIMLKIKKLSDEICAGAATEKEKARLIAEWEAENIYYDHDAASSNVDGNVICLENALALRRTTCAGFSNLFAALCGAQGIVSVNFRGGTVISDEFTLENAPINHEWNAAYCDGEWLFYDTTWATANAYKNGEYIKANVIDNSCIAMGFYQMSEDRRIDKADYRDFYTALYEYQYDN